jgi:nucleoside phosphorylase
MKLLTFAHRGEAQAFISSYQFKPVDFIFDGLLKSNDTFLLITGEGPQSASEKTICVLTKFETEISEVYNIGVAGSLTPKLLLNDLVWIRTAYAHNAEKLEFKSFSTQNSNAHHDCITAFSRILSTDEKKNLSLFANIVDRELWAVASAARLFKKPFNSLKIISDEAQTETLDICKFVKEEAPLFSEKLLLEFQNKVQHLNKILKPKEDSEFLSNPLFYFTTSQERKLNSLLDGLKLKGVSLQSLQKAEEVLRIKEMDKLPKERSRLLIQYLGELLNPVSIKIKASIEETLSPLNEAKINSSFDPDFEENWLNLSVRIQSSRDLEQVKNALKIFSYEDFKKIFEGKFDV